MSKEKINKRILKFSEQLENYIIITLLATLLLVVLYTTIVFIVLLFSGIMAGIEGSFNPDNSILSHLHRVFGGFLSVLIGIELLHTIKMYLRDDIVHVEVVLLVALVGVSRHVIDLDMAHLEPMDLFAMSSLIIALSLGYYFIKRVMRVAPESSSD